MGDIAAMLEIHSLELLEKELDNNDIIYIYGAGRFCYTLLLFLKRIQKYYRKVKSIIVTDGKYNPDSILGISVRALEEEKLDSGSLIIVAAFEKSHSAIDCSLSSLGQKRIFLCNSVYTDLRLGDHDFSVDILNNTQWNSDDLKRIMHNFNSFSARNDARVQYISNQLQSYRDLQNKQISIGMESIWTTIFFNVIANSRWVDEKDFIPNGMAVGSYYLLILYRILESDKMNTFLDIGLGQTSKLISQYARRHDNVMHTVIEADRDWIKAFKKNLLGPVEIIDLNYEELVDEVTGEELRVFEHFSEVLRGRKYNYISIDAPLGTGAKGKSRIDVLSILPDCLEKSFVIMIDDINREGEMHTFEAIKTILKNNNIEYAEARCTGTKMFGIITSWDNRFFCSV